MIPLPIDQALPALRVALGDRTGVVLQAPPGAGKTTRVPLALLDEPWLAGGRIIMLEPRRLAARAAAHRMAVTLGERVGETVGYRVRMDTRVGPSTRIEVVTEGILTRMLQSDPGLDGVGVVIFDEFHERSLNGDLGLALAIESQSVLREDLRILVMSATLDAAPVAALLGNAPVVTSEGRSYPVETRYVERRTEVPLERAVSSVVRDALAREEGDVLVFLPGTGEIRRVADQLSSGLPMHVHVAPLYGNLPQDEQDRAIAPSPIGMRKVVLATSIAETSLTIEGVRVVIDSGVMRVPRFSPASGMTRLDTVRVSRASADQRRGRAGRVAAGVCYRLWAEYEQQALLAHRPPEILEADLAPLALELAAAGVHDPNTLRWLNPPPSGAFAQARELLTHLGALDDVGHATAHGRRMAELGTHPRLAHMLLEGARGGQGTLASYVAALLGERDIVYTDAGPPDADLRLRAEALLALQQGDRADPVAALGYRLDRNTARKVLAEAREWQRHLRTSREAIDLDACGWLLALAYPDRIAQRRAGSVGRFLLRNGRGAALSGGQMLSNAEYVVVADLDGKLPESRIFLAAEITREMLEMHLANEITHDAEIVWDETARAVRTRIREQLGALILSDAPLLHPDPEAVAAVFADAIHRLGIGVLPWSDSARAMQARMIFLRVRDESWLDASDEALLATVNVWLTEHLVGMTRLDDLQRLDLTSLLLGQLSWQQRAALDQRAPSHYVVPTGSRLPIDYSDPENPVLAVRLQEMFGLADTPRIDHGTVPLTLHLLSPAHRPMQVTRDLAGFWRGSYFEVKKEMKGRYPKHEWPDDPLAATPTSRAKRRPT